MIAILLSDTTIYNAPEFEILEEPEFGLQLHMGPFEVPPGGDMELLSYVNPEFTEDVFINRVKMSMRPGSHHFILYTFTDNIPSIFIPEEDEIRPFYNDNGDVIYPDQTSPLTRFIILYALASKSNFKSAPNSPI